MARYYAETLSAAERLIQRDPGQRGRIASARIRRSISTSYYALFHFLLEECTARAVGTKATLLRWRRIVSRVFWHRGLRATLRKVQAAALAPGLADYFGVAVARPFARLLGETFVRAQEQRHEADYDLNASLSELDARILIQSVRDAVRAWQQQNAEADRDFKQALSLLLLLEGRLRTDAG
jgi:uncharacterized protein (UPF0332 family)